MKIITAIALLLLATPSHSTDRIDTNGLEKTIPPITKPKTPDGQQPNDQVPLDLF